MMTIEQAIGLYLTDPSQRTGDLRTDLVAAAKRARRWLSEGPEATAIVLLALSEQFDLSPEQLAVDTGIPLRTVQRRLQNIREGHWS